MKSNFNCSILAVDDEPDNLKVLIAYLKGHGFSIRIAQNGIQAYEFAQKFLPDIILLDIKLPDIDGFQVCTKLKNNENTKDIPVIFMTSYTDVSQKVKGFESGAVDYITKPFQKEEVLARMNAHYTIIRQKSILANQNEELRKLHRAVEQSPSAIFITNKKGEIEFVNQAFCSITGYEEVEVIGSNPRILKSGKHNTDFYKEIWNILTSGKTWKGELLNKKKNGELFWVSSVISPIFDEEEKITHYLSIKQDITERKKTEEKILYMATHDNLTGLVNRVSFMKKLNEILIQSQKEKSLLAILFMDLDGFKSVNDSLGHDAGDVLLCEVTSRLNSILKSTDLAGRFGGDEFTVFMPNIENQESCIQTTEKIVSAMSKEFTIKEKNIQIGCSIGISFFPKDGETAEELIKKADLAMYQAKKNGKNRYEILD
ncbi:MAG: diguanylate cyclase [Leptospiraceae bacterium]|nr:diguanylate cyclase [Leptospiraceae bacterium]